MDARRSHARGNGSGHHHHHQQHGRRFQHQHQHRHQHGHGHGHGHGSHRNGHHDSGPQQQQSSSRGSFWFKGEGYNDFETASIDEEAIGIRGYLNPEQPGFGGLVKQRYSDFIVHEIAANGQRVRLTTLVRRKKSPQQTFHELVSDFVVGGSSTSGNNGSGSELPIPSGHQRPIPEQDALIRDLARRVQRLAAAQNKAAQEALEAHNYRKLVAVVTSELGKKLGSEFGAFLEKVRQRRASSGPSTKPSTEATSEDLVFYIGGLNEKSERVFIHESMRRFGKGIITADTITSPDHSQIIRIRAAVTGPPRKGERDPRRDWPIDRPDYLQFVVYKKNKDIVAVLNQIASVLKVNPTLLSCADVKDKRGITTQHCTAYRIAKERFQNFARMAGRNLDDQNYLVGDLKYVPCKLTNGGCLGNEYEIVLRAIPDDHALPESQLVEIMSAWETRGFVNFFGIQRFGNKSTPFHVIGRALLRKDFKLAVLLLLRPQDGEATKIREAREHFRQHKDVAAALRMLPPFLVPERAVLEGLLQHGIDANELAFRNIPVHLRLGYTEAYQNYVWNQMATIRITQHSTHEPIVGDLVWEKDAGVDETSASKRTIIALTEANVREYTIEDVLLPLPGFNVQYPANEIGAAYEKLLVMDGINFASWASATQSANHHPYDLRGSYRHLLKRPTNVSYRVQMYTDSSQAMLLNDVDVLLGRTAVPEIPREKSQDSEAAEKRSRTPERALILRFRLDYGSDATIAIRELMKQSSSVHTACQASEPTGDRVRRGAQKNGTPADRDATGKKRSSSTALPGNKSKEAKTAGSKKAQVAIGRPGFSLGRC